MKQETIKIQLLNDTQLSIRPVLPDGKTVVPVDDITNLRVSWGVNGHEVDPMYEPTITKQDGYLVIPISSTLPLGVYDVHIQGTIDGREVSDNRHAMFELVKYGNGIAYEKYYTEMVIIGLPDSYVQQLREELERKIAEYEAAIEELQEKILSIGGIGTPDDGEEIASIFGRLKLILTEIGDNYYSEGSMSLAEMVDDIRKRIIAGPITPEQWAQIAKEATLDEIKEAISHIHVDIPTDYAKEATLGHFNKGLIVTIATSEYIEDDHDYVGTFRHNSRTYYKWALQSDPTSFIYTMVRNPQQGTAYYGLEEATDTMVQWGNLVNVYTESVAHLIQSQASKLDTIIANTSLTAAQADEDWQNIQPA